MRFGVLGDLAATTGDGEPIALGPRKQRLTLAVLLAKANQVVPVDQLIDAVWGATPPKTAGKNLQVYVHHLRQLMDDPARISREPTGYRLRVDPGELDADRFTELVGEGRPREALSLWRGEPYAGLHNVEELKAAADQLTDRRLAAIESRVDADLAGNLAGTAGLVDELTDLVEKWPWRERFVGQLMRALHRAGRQADALAVYERGRAAMADRLGIDPSPQLRRIEREVRAGAYVPVPAQLPADVAGFAGRHEHLDADHRIIAISGPAGVGKTALAIRIGHRLRPSCPDGQLYVNLAGAHGRPGDPTAVLAGFLRALGTPSAAIPDSLGERTALYRELLAGRRLLVVLDNAADQRQIEPLLPDNDTCRVVITSRVRLPVGHQIDLRPLELADSLDLIHRMVGDREDAEAARELAELCGGLPLALKVAGAKLVTRTHWTLRELVDRLGDEHRRLDELRYRQLEVRASFALSYQGLTEPAARLFRLLGLLDSPDVAGWVAAALLDCAIADAEPLLAELVDTQLLESAGRDAAGQHRYRFHDLLRVYARERVRTEEEAAERTASLARAFGAWLTLLDRAHAAVFGRGQQTYAARWSPPDGWPELLLDASLAWPDSERANLMAAVRQAADQAELADFSWELAALAIEEFSALDEGEDWRDAGAYALAALIRLGHSRGQAAVGLQLGALHAGRRRYAEAVAEIDRAHELFTEIGDGHGVGLALRHRGIMAMAAGDLHGSWDLLQEARALLSESGDLGAEAHALVYLGRIAAARGEVEVALRTFAESTELARRAPAEKLFYEATFWTGQTLLSYGRPGAAETLHTAADQLLALGARVADAYGLLARGDACRAAGRLAESNTFFAECLTVARQNRDRLMQARALARMAQLAVRRGRGAKAVDLVEQCLPLVEHGCPPLDHAQLLDAAGDAHHAAGSATKAAAYWRRSADLLAALGLADADRIAAKLSAAAS
ncbi:AfsR/SARP family transcriptional regulator [Fodinicola acaciae]|uniref:AfsR/SARP family transcriptional regulator n=1 Tax=Fodinicola acaciae TaxID=2681555 RepID=UPI001FE5F54A|nr:BTAD domain-containing putative transcriptional regulator [Fodinicola acaciae]